jgi:iron complex transport system substrate-binding protein
VVACRVLARAAIAAALTALLALGCSRPRHHADGAVRRVVTLTPSSTEITAAAGGLSRIVGVDRFSSVPPEVADLPRVGDFLSPRIESILALDPDLVVLDRVQQTVADKLAAAGVATLVLDIQRIEDVRAGLAAVGDALGTRADADRTIAAMDRAIAATRARAATRTTRPRTLMVVDRELGGLRGLVAAGPGTYLDELCTVAGGANAMADVAVRYPKLAADRVVEAAPDVILDATHADDPAAAVADWRSLEHVPAIEAGRVHILSSSLFTAPSPRVGEALAELERLLYP